MTQKTSTKILLYNVGYLAGLDGSFKDYLLHFLRYFYTPKRVWKSVLQSVDQLIQAENPDVCCFTEVRKASKYIHKLCDYSFHDFENKYGLHSFLRHLPYFRKNCIGFFSHTNLPYQKHFFRKGMKKLVYEIKLSGDVSLLLAHLALRKKARKRQLKELKELIKEREKVILCGDFNIFNGIEELEEILEECCLKVVNTLRDLTFPSVYPQKALDLFLCSEGIDITGFKVLHPVAVSDHLPVLLEVRV